MRLSEATYFPDAKELTRHGFVSHMEDFIGKLIGDNPLKADVDDYLKGFDIDSKKALEMLTKPEIDGVPESAVVMRTERIKNGGTDEFGKPMKDEFQVIYRVPKKDMANGIKGIDEKLRNLYIKLFENHIVEGTVLNEDGEGGMCGDGGAMEDMGGASTTFSAGNYPYDSNALGKKKSGKQDEEKDTDFTIMRRRIYKVTESKKKMKRPIGRLTMFITEEQMQQLAQLIKEDGECNLGVDGPKDWTYDAPGFEAKDKGFFKGANVRKHILSRESPGNQAVGHDGRSVKESINEMSWSITDDDIRFVERNADSEKWQRFIFNLFTGIENGRNRSVIVKGYVYSPKGEKLSDEDILLSYREWFVKDVEIIYDFFSPDTTRLPKVKLGKIWGGNRFEILGLTENGEEMFQRYQFTRDKLPGHII